MNSAKPGRRRPPPSDFTAFTLEPHLEKRIDTLEKKIEVSNASLERKIDVTNECTKAELVRWVFVVMLGNVALSAGATAILNVLQHSH
jgi:hypothetical protein